MASSWTATAGRRRGWRRRALPGRRARGGRRLIGRLRAHALPAQPHHRAAHRPLDDGGALRAPLADGGGVRQLRRHSTSVSARLVHRSEGVDHRDAHGKLRALDGPAAGVQGSGSSTRSAPPRSKSSSSTLASPIVTAPRRRRRRRGEAGGGDGGGGGADFGSALGLDAQSDAAGGGAEAVSEFVVRPATLDWQRRLGIEGDDGARRWAVAGVIGAWLGPATSTETEAAPTCERAGGSQSACTVRPNVWWYWPLARRSFRTASITRAAACRRTAIAACANAPPPPCAAAPPPAAAGRNASSLRRLDEHIVDAGHCQP